MTWTAEDESTERARVQGLMLQPHAVFVFGSNQRGVHGAGAAACAVQYHGAQMGNGAGLQGRSYAWPTKSWWIETLPLPAIAEGAARLVACAIAHPELLFVVTRVGCGLAGLTDEEMAGTLPADLPPNMALTPRWVEIRERAP
jgi:hypothetical protein